MPITEPAAPSNRAAATRTIFWAAVWLALVLVGLKAFYLGAPGAPAVSVGQGYLRPIRSDGYLTKECQPGDRGALLWIVKGLEQKISETVTNGPLHAFRFQK